jgi:hypothetical protein
MEENILDLFDPAVSHAADHLRRIYAIPQEISLVDQFEIEFNCTVAKTNEGIPYEIAFHTANDRLLFQLRWTK